MYALRVKKNLLCNRKDKRFCPRWQRYIFHESTWITRAEVNSLCLLHLGESQKYIPRTILCFGKTEVTRFILFVGVFSEALRILTWLRSWTVFQQAVIPCYFMILSTNKYNFCVCPLKCRGSNFQSVLWVWFSGHTIVLLLDSKMNPTSVFPGALI